MSNQDFWIKYVYADMPPKGGETPKARRRRPVLDAAGNPMPGPAAQWEEQRLRMDTAGAIQQWLEDDALSPGETTANRLLALLVGIADQSQDGKLDDDEQAVMDVVISSAWDFFTALGVSEEDIKALLEDWDDTVAERVRDLAIVAMPNGDDENDAAMEAFVFGDGDQEALFDAAFVKRWVVRGGRKVQALKRIGSVFLSAAQKVSIRMAQLKSHSALAKARRLKSMQVRENLGL